MVYQLFVCLRTVIIVYVWPQKNINTTRNVNLQAGCWEQAGRRCL